MTTARETIIDAAAGRGCLGKAADDEPVFVIRAQDKFAPVLVRLWAELVVNESGNSKKTADAMILASEMQKWPDRKIPD